MEEAGLQYNAAETKKLGPVDGAQNQTEEEEKGRRRTLMGKGLPWNSCSPPCQGGNTREPCNRQRLHPEQDSTEAGQRIHRSKEDTGRRWQTDRRTWGMDKELPLACHTQRGSYDGGGQRDG